MTAEMYQWQSLILRLEREARDNPGLYRFRVSALACLPGVYVAFILLGALAVLGGLGYAIFWLIVHLRSLAVLKFLVPVCLGVLGFIVTLFSALTICVPEPEGIEVTREEAVPLFIEIDRLRTQLNVPRFHRVFLCDSFNAGVTSVPRFGLFGGHRHYLIIGIPLMASLSPNHFRAVLAHELGHIAGGHGRFGAWVHQIYHTWLSLLFALESEDRASIVLFEAFFAWFAPLFGAYTFVVRRQNEYEADRAAAQIVGGETMAGALVATDLAEIALASEHSGPIDPKTAQQWLNMACSVRTNYEDVHPSLTDRLRALNQKPLLPGPVEETALLHFFRHKTPMLLQRCGYEIIFSAGEETETPPAQTTASLPPTTAQSPTTSDVLRPIGY